VAAFTRPLAGLFLDRQIDHREITRALRDCSLVRIDQTCFGRSGGLAPTSLPLCQGTRFDAAGAGFSLSCSHSPRLVRTTSMASAQTFSRVGRRPVTEEQPPSRSQKLAAEIDPQRSSGRASSCKRLCHNHHSFTDLCSIISSARSRNDSGIASPSVLAVLRLMTISNFAGNCTGRSPGFAPRRMRSTANREPVHSGRRCNRPPAPGDRFRGKLDSRFASFPRSRGQSCPQSCGDEAGLWARGSWEAPGLEVKLLTPRSSSRDASRHLLILQAPGLRRSPLPPARLGLARSAFVQ
jgi:hypothetical protein